MQKLSLAGIAVAAMMAAGLAASAAAAHTRRPNNWTGCYVGGNLGGSWASTEWANPQNQTPGDRGTANFSGIVGGGQIGCDYQFANRWLTGIQGTFDWTKLKGDVRDTHNTSYDLQTEIQWLGTITGRLGFAVQPNLLLYGKGGVAWVRDDHSETHFGGPYASGNVTRTGWTAGAGVEWKFAPDWSAFAEYDYLDFGRHNDPLVLASGGPHSWDITQHLQTAIAGVNWRF